MERTLGVSASASYDWQHRQRRPAPRTVADAELRATTVEIHTQSRGTYGSLRVHAEPRLGLGIRVGRRRVERRMRQAGIEGVYRRRRPGCRKRPQGELAEDLVNRESSVEGPERLWVTDITQHPTSEGWVYAAVVLDAWS
jgi:transposase InsO family protein